MSRLLPSVCPSVTQYERLGRIFTKFDFGILDEKSSKRELRENRLIVIRTLGFMSSGMAPSVVGLVLTDVWNGTSGLHQQILFFMDCLNLDT